MNEYSHSHTKFIIPIIVLLLAAAGLGFWAYMQMDALDAANIEAEVAQDQLDMAQIELTQMMTSLAGTEEELLQTGQELTEAQSDLVAAQNELSTVQDELGKSKTALSVALADAVSANERFDSLQDDYLELLNDYDSVTDGYGYVFSDPTYQEMKDFLEDDKTDLNKYDINTYNCQNFSADVIDNAAKLNIRCAFVSIDEKDSGHAIIAFNTTDKGIIFIEPQSDEEVNLQIGVRYYKCIIPKEGYYYTAPSYDDTVVRYVIVW